MDSTQVFSAGLPCRRRGLTWKHKNCQPESCGPSPLLSVLKMTISVVEWVTLSSCRSSKTQPTKLRQAPCLTHRPKPGKMQKHSPRSPVTSNHQDILTNVLGTKILRNQPLIHPILWSISEYFQPFSSVYHLQSRLMSMCCWYRILKCMWYQDISINFYICSSVHTSIVP